MERKSFDELYRDILQQKIDLREPLPPEYDPLHLDCLLHPKNYAPVFQTTQFQNCEEEIKRKCIQSCLFEAIKEGENGKVSIDTEKCTGCGGCIHSCLSLIHIFLWRKQIRSAWMNFHLDWDLRCSEK